MATDRSSRIVVDREPITLSVALDEVIAYYAVLTRSPTPMQEGKDANRSRSRSSLFTFCKPDLGIRSVDAVANRITR